MYTILAGGKFQERTGKKVAAGLHSCLLDSAFRCNRNESDVLVGLEKSLQDGHLLQRGSDIKVALRDVFET